MTAGLSTSRGLPVSAPIRAVRVLGLQMHTHLALHGSGKLNVDLDACPASA